MEISDGGSYVPTDFLAFLTRTFTRLLTSSTFPFNVLYNSLRRLPTEVSRKNLTILASGLINNKEQKTEKIQ